MNYKKSLISLVAAMALSTSAFADSNAIYVPMSNETNDGLWTLIGVNGLSTGVASGYGQSTAGFSSGYDSLEDSNTSDYLETLGLDNLVSVQALQSAGLTGLEIAMPVAGVTFEKKEPVRSMYVKVDSSTPNVKINYKASLEGVGVEFYINNDLDTRYVSTISQDSTYADAVDATLFDGSASDATVLSTITDVLDFNSTDNPVEAKYFDASTDLLATGTSAIFYHFDAVSQQWKIWDKTLTGSANDFTEFTVGDAYWGQVDRNETGAAIASNAGGATALILGKSGNTVPSADTYRVDDTVAYNKSSNSRLSAGWNMIALDNIKPNVRHASTGLVITTKDINATIVLKDSTGAHSISVDLIDTDPGSDQATAINLKFEKEKIAGTIPPYFNVKAFGTDDAAEIILISDARFTIEDDRTTPADFIGAVKTLNNKNPYNNLGGNVIDITELDHNSSDTIGNMESATSAYGEYALVLNTLVGASSVDTITGAQGFSKIEFGDATNGDHGAFGFTTGSSDIAGAVAGISALSTLEESSFEPVVTAIDTDNNGAADMVIVANDIPFYVKDKTYTRVFELSGDSSAAYDITFVGSNESNITVGIDENASDVVTTMTTAGVEGIYGAQNAANTKLIAVSIDKSNFDVKDVTSQTIDILTNSSESEDIAKGAIGSVHALDEIAKISLVPHIWTASGFSLNPTDINDTNDTICVEIVSTIDGNGTMCTPINPDDINTSGVSLLNGQDTNVTARLRWFDAIVNDMTVQISDSSLHGYAYHTYTTDADNLTTADVVLVSYDANLTFTTVAADMQMPTTTFADSNDALTLGGSGVLGGKLTNDLTTNPVHTPDFASYGPLYTMYDAGYDVRAILKAETDLSAGDIIWDSIDLTRDEDDWFLNNEMNMFKTNLYSGYWVYLTELTAPEIIIGTPTYNSIYTYYFDKDAATATEQDSTTNIVNGGSLTVNVTGINVDTSSVFAKIGGIEFEMKRSGTSDDYTADLTSYAVSGFAQDTSGPTAVTIRVTNGKGEYKKDDSFEYDFTPPTINAVTYPSITEVQFNTDETDTTFHIFKNYIPELASTRADATLTTLIASQASTTGSSIVNICKELTFGETPEIVVITADGDGTIGNVNLSDAETFTYAVMFKGAQVLSHSEASTDDKSIYGTIYDDNCTVETTAANNTIAGNSGISLKSLVANSTAYLSYAEKDVASDLSGAYEQIWTIDSTEVIQVQSLDEYKGETFFVEYDSKLYKGTFPDNGIEVNEPLELVTSVNSSLQ